MTQAIVPMAQTAAIHGIFLVIMVNSPAKAVNTKRIRIATLALPSLSLAFYRPNEPNHLPAGHRCAYPGACYVSAVARSVYRGSVGLAPPGGLHDSKCSTNHSTLNRLCSPWQEDRRSRPLFSFFLTKPSMCVLPYTDEDSPFHWKEVAMTSTILAVLAPQTTAVQ